MPSEHPFDQHLKQSFDGFEPDVQPDWTGFERDLNRQAPQAPAQVHAGRGTGRLAVAAAVVAGGVMMWVAKPMVEEQALEQWLRRVPDDPGGLLRRKFRYQTMQRLREGEEPDESIRW